jgi:16S rRNA (cytosine1402-N4)-methyltransferase
LRFLFLIRLAFCFCFKPSEMDNRPESPTNPESKPHRRRVRYAGKYPRRFEEKYKERNPDRYAATVAKVIASGKTPAGMHRPIMVQEILQVLAPHRGDIVADCTLGYGGHAQELLAHIQPGGLLLGVDSDPQELPKTAERLRALGFGPSCFRTHRSNFAGLPQVLAAEGLEGVDVVLADLGVSSMQLDDPSRGFSHKHEGPLDMRMNSRRGQSAADLLARLGEADLAGLLVEAADEPRAQELAKAIAGRRFSTTRALAHAVQAAIPRVNSEEKEVAIRRVFQALRIAVNDEFSALEMFLRHLPDCLKSGGRVAILSFHSGEDRRVKKSLVTGLRNGVYSEISPEVLRPGAAERYSNPRCTSAKLRWARRA